MTPSTHKTSNPVTATSTPDLHTPTVALVDSDVFQAGTYGPVQISVVIVDGIITDISMAQQPDSNSHSRDLTRIVFPNLISNVVESQANGLTISGVTGASYDFVAFKQALQSVLNKAKL